MRSPLRVAVGAVAGASALIRSASPKRATAAPSHQKSGGSTRSRTAPISPVGSGRAARITEIRFLRQSFGSVRRAPDLRDQGVGASARSRPSCLSSAQKSGGTSGAKIARFCSTSAGERVPGMTVATAG
jgi:hypothetical protein